jgi:hypothetical protein
MKQGLLRNQPLIFSSMVEYCALVTLDAVEIDAEKWIMQAVSLLAA